MLLNETAGVSATSNRVPRGAQNLYCFMMDSNRRGRNFEYDAVVVGSGPNGLAAALTVAMEGHRVLVLEKNSSVGGGLRSGEVTLPGFIHDWCSAVFPLAVGSPFFRRLPLQEHGLSWVHPDYPLAHPLDNGSAAVLYRSLEETGRRLGRDGTAYNRLMEPFIRRWNTLADDILGPVIHLPTSPLLLGRFGLRAIQSARGLAQRTFRDPEARALYAGMAAHSFLSLDAPVSASFGLVLGATGHAVGWPVARGGAGEVTAAMVSLLRSLGGEIVTDTQVTSIDELPPSRLTFLDVTPRQVLQLARHRLPARYCRRLERFRYGPGVFKIDYALSGPIPWTSKECRLAGTVHVGGTLEEIAAAEQAVMDGEHPEAPFVLVAQQSLFDSTRAPAGKHTAWCYCHVPNGSTVDMQIRIERQMERFAPGFRDLVLARTVRTPADFEAANPNMIGGDINGGSFVMPQWFARPMLSLSPYRTPIKGLYICSSSTPPGGGVHGMCGHHAANAAMKGEL